MLVEAELPGVAHGVVRDEAHGSPGPQRIVAIRALGSHVDDHQGLLAFDEHAEFGSAATRGNFERAAYVQATWRD